MKLRESIRDSVAFELNEQWAKAVYKTLPHKTLAENERFVAALDVLVIDWLDDVTTATSLSSSINDNCSWPVTISATHDRKHVAFSTYVPDDSGRAKSASLVIPAI